MKVAALILAMFLAAVSAAGQVTTNKDDITEADFDKVQSVGLAGLKGKAYRDTSISEEFVNGTIQKDKTQRETTEILPPNRSRYVSISTNNGKDESREVIRVGSNVWVRVNNGQWEQNPAPEMKVGASLPRTISKTYRIIGASRSNGNTLTLYEQMTREARTAGGDSPKEQIVTLRYWVDKDGLFQQKLYETFDLTSNTIKRRYTFYEYDPKDLKIEAPVVK